VFEYLEMLYNPKRKKHTRSGMLLPAQFERRQMLKRKGVGAPHISKAGIIRRTTVYLLRGANRALEDLRAGCSKEPQCSFRETTT